MNRKYTYFILCFSIVAFLFIPFFFIGNKLESQTTPDVQEESPQTPNYISGTGIVEPASGNIMISSTSNRIVERVDVAVNDHVKKGDILFQTYNQDLKAILAIKHDQYEESLANLQKLEALPRCEDLIIAQENLNKAQAHFNEAIIEYRLANRCAKTKVQRCLNLYKYQQAEADFLVARAEFSKVKSGAWQPDVRIARNAMSQAQANIEAAQRELERTYVTAPVDGTVLQVKVRQGETLDPNKSAIIIGNIEELNLRVSIDQFNASKFCRDCRAVAFKQGDSKTEFPLKFLYAEPSMVPKKYLTNALHEKVDTQIFEIVYRIEKKDAYLFIGEQMDVHIYLDQK